MRFIKGAVVLGLAVSFCLAQLNISGTVTDSLTGSGILGAVVSLKNTGLSVTTNPSGAFTLSRASGATEITGLGSKVLAPSAPVMSEQGEIRLNLQEPSRVTVKTYSVGGKQIGSMERTLGAGSHSIMPAKANSGMHLYQVLINGTAYTLQQANVNGSRGAYALHQANVNGSGINPFQGLARSAASLAFPDSIVVAKADFATQKRQLTDSVASGLSFKMKANDQTCALATCGYTGTSQTSLYYVNNNTWNTKFFQGGSIGDATQCLYVCSYHYWYVVAKMTNHAGEVQSYPCIQALYPSKAINSIQSISVDFAETSPHGIDNIYNVAFDIWVNGCATTTCTEVMIWNDNWYQWADAAPAQPNVCLGGRWWTPHVSVQGNGHQGYMVWLPTVPFYSATNFDVLEILKYCINQGWMPTTSVLTQVQHGVEICSTGGKPVTFLWSNYECRIQ